MKHLHIKNIFSRFSSDAYFDWVIIVTFTFICGFAGVVGAISLFLNIRSGSALIVSDAHATEASSAIPTLDNAHISRLIQSLEQKQAQEEAIRQTSYTKTADPAL